MEREEKKCACVCMCAGSINTINISFNHCKKRFFILFLSWSFSALSFWLFHAQFSRPLTALEN